MNEKKKQKKKCTSTFGINLHYEKRPMTAESKFYYQILNRVSFYYPMKTALTDESKRHYRTLNKNI